MLTENHGIERLTPVCIHSSALSITVLTGLTSSKVHAALILPTSNTGHSVTNSMHLVHISIDVLMWQSILLSMIDVVCYTLTLSLWSFILASIIQAPYFSAFTMFNVPFTSLNHTAALFLHCADSAWWFSPSNKSLFHEQRVWLMAPCCGVGRVLQSITMQYSSLKCHSTSHFVSMYT